ncbi:hypothetical protein DPMN_153585 [Dreissena polymorpha]|uniref:Uncharacterized protein n=1 Tax=Dreissena polymorpha TaxID=45954 RepID=A0A9D4FNF1_DREPO|nr:hypothetical protein DPMN_153585 [Dreissena polymorpha]
MHIILCTAPLHRDDLIWQLTRDKTPYSAGNLKTSGRKGQWELITTGRKGELEVPYNGWELLKGEIQELLYQIAKGAGMVSPVQIQRVTDVTLFVRAVCRSQPGAAEGLADIVSLLYMVIQRRHDLSGTDLLLGSLSRHPDMRRFVTTFVKNDVRSLICKIVPIERHLENMDLYIGNQRVVYFNQNGCQSFGLLIEN